MNFIKIEKSHKRMIIVKFVLTLIWVGFLGVRFEVGTGGGE